MELYYSTENGIRACEHTCVDDKHAGLRFHLSRVPAHPGEIVLLCTRHGSREAVMTAVELQLLAEFLFRATRQFPEGPWQRECNEYACHE